MDEHTASSSQQLIPNVYNNVGYFSSLKTPRSGTHRDHGVGRWEMGVAHPTSLCRVQYITTVHTGRVCVCVCVCILLSFPLTLISSFCHLSLLLFFRGSCPIFYFQHRLGWILGLSRLYSMKSY